MNELKQKILAKMKQPTLSAFATVTDQRTPYRIEFNTMTPGQAPEIWEA